jgi:hypothetical protein
MSSKGRFEDLSALLYLVPFVASAVYAIYLWVRAGVTAILPPNVYLTVTRDPILFVLGSLAILLAVVLEVTSADPEERPSKVASVSNTLQSIALASLILAFLSALYSNGFFDLSGAATDFVVGRYALVFPAVLILFSYLVRAQFRVGALLSRRTLAIVSLLLVPASLYVIGKRQPALGLGAAFVFLLIGVVPFVLPAKKAKGDESKAPDS